MFVDKSGNFLFVVEVVGHAVIGHVVHLFGLEFQVVEGVLEVIKIHSAICNAICI